MELTTLQQQVKRNDSKIILLIMDGLGGLPLSPGGLTELETAQTPNLDALAASGICGLHEPVAHGITPGSGPAHLGVFGYDPLEYQVGRGVLSAGGINFDLQPGDVAARGNFCTVDENGVITDRRAGRIATEKGQELTKLLREEVKIPGVEIFVETVKEYRYLLVLRGEGLSGEIAETDPQQVGKKPYSARALTPAAEKTAGLVRQFVQRAGEVLAAQRPANMLTLRGFSQLPTWPTMEEAFGLHAIGIAMYPMYRGVAKLVGMDVPPASHSVEEEIEVLKKNWDNYDFFFFHVKRTDSAGEDGDFNLKVSIIEKVDRLLPRILALQPDVIIITGDHSTPAKMRSHSWHPVPLLLWSQLCRPDLVQTFGERACLAGGLGNRLPAKDIMPLALAHAQRLNKFGA
ncbi:MAG: 2,3-bisphosphoglycerate-independent phosphoglycerate mutase [Chloroflexota bacterium]|nr:2,3-bisphosphoglycerate-independent phosphoglycerate mutase [Chloroflexota bacterium]